MRKKRVLIGGGILALSLVIIAGFILRAPGMTLNEEEMGFGLKSTLMREVSTKTSEKALKIDGVEKDFSDLGLSVDKELFKDTLKGAFLWNFAFWSREVIVPVKISDEERFLESMNEILIIPESAKVVFDEETESLKVTQGREGTTLEVEKFLDAVNSSDLVDLSTTPLPPLVSDEEAEKTLAHWKKYSDELTLLNGENEFRLPPEVLLRSLSLYSPEYTEVLVLSEGQQSEGASNNEIITSIDREVIDEFVDQTDFSYPSVNGSAVVDEEGKHLKVLEEWSSGFKEAPKEEISEVIHQGIQEEVDSITIPGDLVEAKVEEKFRKAVVDQGSRQTHLYENGELVTSFPVAVGKAGTPTHTGEFRVFWQTPLQDMGCDRPDLSYCTRDVPWATYFNGDEAFHGAYWHGDFGNPYASRQSHGCVNMRIPDSKFVYEFLQVGSPVSVHW